ncbi:DUF6233 domain-containing protein [Streptomyces sp. NPDC001373]|uniref:DUF6233 domain-containing protein n=1 Tax=Streptomyces sp. NPDC001373 TaxID=3364565 RepID=UPI003685AA03
MSSAAPGVADRARDRHRPARRARPHRRLLGHPHPLQADTARRALTEGVPACPQCRPDTALGMLD